MPSAIVLLTVTSLLFSGTVVNAASSCNGQQQQYNDAPGFPASNSGCYPLNYYQTSDLGQTSPDDAKTRCQQQCTSMASRCASVVAQVNKAADSNLYSGTCFFFTPGQSIMPRRCSDTAYLLEGYSKDNTLNCFSSSLSSASAYCSSYQSIPLVTSSVTKTPSPVTTTSTITKSSVITTITTGTITPTTTIHATSTVTATVTTNTVTITTTTATTTTNTNTVSTTVTSTVTASSSVQKRAATTIPPPACLTSTPATRLSSACACLSVTKSTTTTTTTLVPQTSTATTTITTPTTMTVAATVTAPAVSTTVTSTVTQSNTATATSTSTVINSVTAQSTTTVTSTTTTTVTAAPMSTSCSTAQSTFCGQCACFIRYPSGAAYCADLCDCVTCTDDATCNSFDAGRVCVYVGVCGPGGSVCAGRVSQTCPTGTPPASKLKREIERVFEAAARARVWSA